MSKDKGVLNQPQDQSGHRISYGGEDNEFLSKLGSLPEGDRHRLMKRLEALMDAQKARGTGVLSGDKK